MRSTRAVSMRNAGGQTLRVARLVGELSNVQKILSERMRVYQQECSEAVELVSRAASLTERLKVVRMKLRMVFDNQDTTVNSSANPSSVLSFYESIRLRGEEEVLPGLGINDDVTVIKPTHQLPEFHDDLDSFSDPPADYMCPITCCVMRYPVITIDGYSYEKHAIVEWFNSFTDGFPTSPCTNLPLNSTELIDNTELRDKIQDWARIMRGVDESPKVNSKPVRKCPPSPPAKENDLSRDFVCYGTAAPTATVPSSSPIWSSSHVPSNEHDAASLNQLRDCRSFHPPPRTPLTGSRAVLRGTVCFFHCFVLQQKDVIFVGQKKKKKNRQPQLYDPVAH